MTAHLSGTTGLGRSCRATPSFRSLAKSVAGQAWVTPEAVDVVASATTGERLRRLNVNHLLPEHWRPVHGKGALAAALNPSEGPKGCILFSSGLLRCLSGRVRLDT
jgi:hypothetical protein